jgi:hypothetical protein
MGELKIPLNPPLGKGDLLGGHPFERRTHLVDIPLKGRFIGCIHFSKGNM